MAITKIIAVLAITAVAAEQDLSSIRDLVGRRLKCADKVEEGCKCYMGCEVYGGDSGKCTDKKEDNAKLMAEKQPKIDDKKKMCDTMMCGAYCAKSLECADDEFKDGCENYKKMDKDCGVDCSGANPTAILGMTALLFAGVMQI